MAQSFYEHRIVAVADLVPYATNARTHSDAQVAQIAGSIREWPWRCVNLGACLDSWAHAGAPPKERCA